MIFEIRNEFNFYRWYLLTNAGKVIGISNIRYAKKSECYDEIDSIVKAFKSDDIIKEDRSNAKGNSSGKFVPKTKG